MVTPNSGIVSALTGIQAEVLATLGAIAPVALGIFAVFLGWKYGKRLFQTVAK